MHGLLCKGVRSTTAQQRELGHALLFLAISRPNVFATFLRFQTCLSFAFLSSVYAADLSTGNGTVFKRYLKTELFRISFNSVLFSLPILFLPPGLRSKARLIIIANLVGGCCRMCPMKRLLLVATASCNAAFPDRVAHYCIVRDVTTPPQSARNTPKRRYSPARHITK